MVPVQHRWSLVRYELTPLISSHDVRTVGVPGIPRCTDEGHTVQIVRIVIAEYRSLCEFIFLSSLCYEPVIC